MIAKITRGADPGGIGAYLHGPGRGEEHVYGERVGGAVIAGTIPVLEERSPVEWVSEMRAAIGRRPDISRPVWQVSLRAAPGDRTLSDGEWAHAAQGFAQAMGFADHPWVAVRHGGDHIHVVVSRVDHDGQVWHGRFDRRQAQQACAQLEVEHRLSRAPRTRGAVVEPGDRRDHQDRQPWRGPADGQLTQGEWQRAVKTHVNPARVALAERVHTAAALAAGRGRAAFEDELRRVGVTYQANEASTGRMNGYRFADPAHRDPGGVPVWFKASQLDKSLSWAALRVRLEDPPLRPGEQPAQRRLQTRSARARELAAAQDVARAGRDRYATAARPGAHRSLRFANAQWERTWQQRAQADPAHTAAARARDQLQITPQVGDVVAGVAELEAAAYNRLLERILIPRSARRATRGVTAEDLHPSRGYTPPAPDRDHGLGR